MMRSFRTEFDDLFAEGLISAVEIGLGASGELKYPSFSERMGWRYPGIGEFQVRHTVAPFYNSCIILYCKYCGSIFICCFLFILLNSAMINICNTAYAEQPNYVVTLSGPEDLIMLDTTILCHMKLDSFVSEVIMTTIMDASSYIGIPRR